MVSISQWIQQHLPSDADLGTTPKALDDAAGDLGRLAKQADSSVGAFGYKALGSVFELGRNIGTPFEQNSHDCDRLARQSESTVARFGYSAVGAFFSLSQGVSAAP